jgi:hypothetical protein
MHEMCLEAIYPKKNLSQPAQRGIKFPYLMNNTIRKN